MLYGRGVNDDKGPLLAALYAMARIRQEGRTLYHPIRLIAGGAEETTWECMEHYFKHNPQPIFGFSPDGNFPIVNGEKGILQVRFLLNADSDISLHCKERLHIVCDDLQVIVPKGSDVSFVERTNLIEVMQDGIKSPIVVYVHFPAIRSAGIMLFSNLLRIFTDTSIKQALCIRW